MIDRATCESLDERDPLRDFRELFDVDDDIVYLDGNSLGRPPRAARERIDAVVGDEWARGLVRSWTDAGWMDAPLRTGACIARVIGAHPDEVVVGDSTSVCLFKLMTAALRARPQRPVVVTEDENFPTDLYVAGAVTQVLEGRQLRHVPRRNLGDAIDDDTALVTLTHIDFRSGDAHDLVSMTRAAHAHGALMLWDLSHSAGAVTVDIDDADADLAVGCGYKYLNGGPGAPAYMFVRRDLQTSLSNPMPGWLGHET
ncbi:MAG: aminotransferase class V-fold PLP-dependent enzyme, partial [Candidatus Dormibacteria bacterium]